MGLKFPHDLAAWHEWEKKNNYLRYLKGKLNKVKPRTEFILATKKNSQPAIMVALELSTPTQRAALLAPATVLEQMGISVAILTTAATEDFLVSQGYTETERFSAMSYDPPSLENVKQVIAAGHYLAAGEWAYAKSREKGWAFNVVQHGLNTPFAPPLPQDCVLFSFSEKDSEFWISGREDITAHAVGSQLFYEASKNIERAEPDVSGDLLFLGQMHGAELPRTSFAKASYRFCKNNGATYRPHPSERDKLSKLTHSMWGKLGIKFDTSGVPLNQSNQQVVSVFSTGVLEAAIRGIPAWVYHPQPPTWLLEFWDRYNMHQWGQPPTPAPVQPETEPAQKIASIIAQTLENS